MHPKELLKRFDLDPKQSLGQNFLSDPNVLQKIVAAGSVDGADHVLEIGPGLGSLTRQLAKAASAVVAVELDQRFLPILDYELAAFDNITVVHADILKWQPADHFTQPYKVVANIPYYITGAIIRHLLESKHKPTTIVLTVQKDVAERMSAKPGKMSILAVSTQLYGTVKVVETIAAGAFWPRPKVDSAIVRIDVAPPKAINEKLLFSVVKVGFSQKRKQLKNNLRGLGLSTDEVSTALEAVAVDGKRRAETLTIPEWIDLTNAISNRDA